MFNVGAAKNSSTGNEVERVTQTQDVTDNIGKISTYEFTSVMPLLCGTCSVLLYMFCYIVNKVLHRTVTLQSIYIMYAIDALTMDVPDDCPAENPVKPMVNSGVKETSVGSMECILVFLIIISSHLDTRPCYNACLRSVIKCENTTISPAAGPQSGDSQPQPSPCLNCKRMKHYH